MNKFRIVLVLGFLMAVMKDTHTMQLRRTISGAKLVASAAWRAPVRCAPLRGSSRLISSSSVRSQSQKEKDDATIVAFDTRFTALKKEQKKLDRFRDSGFLAGMVTSSFALSQSPIMEYPLAYLACNFAAGFAGYWTGKVYYHTNHKSESIWGDSDMKMMDELKKLAGPVLDPESELHRNTNYSHNQLVHFKEGTQSSLSISDQAAQKKKLEDQEQAIRVAQIDLKFMLRKAIHPNDKAFISYLMGEYHKCGYTCDKALDLLKNEKNNSTTK
jgi:hypothetical protein